MNQFHDITDSNIKPKWHRTLDHDILTYSSKWGQVSDSPAMKNLCKNHRGYKYSSTLRMEFRRAQFSALQKIDKQTDG